MAKYPHALVSSLITRRRELGLTQREVSQRINVSQGTVAQWESGRNLPPVDRLESYAGAVGMRLVLLPAGEAMAS